MNEEVNEDVKAILFDLGGVLVELDGPPLLAEWLDEPITLEENKRRWAQCSAVEEFEKGNTCPEVFVEDVIRELGLNVSTEAFLTRFMVWPAGLYPGVLELLEQLRGRFVLAFYSNTSELHWPQIMGRLGLNGRFDHYFASFQIGFYKPDLKSFGYVAGEMSLPEKHILFLDDSAANVAAASQAGMRSAQVQGVEEVKSVLKELKLI